MYYKPHTLQKKVSTISRDEYGRIITKVPGTPVLTKGQATPTPYSEEWQDVGVCRCDDNTQQEFRTDNGAVYRPKYHIVAEGDVDVHAGDEVRCIRTDDSGGEEQTIIRGEGKVYQAKHLNKLHYTDIWV